MANGKSCGKKTGYTAAQKKAYVTGKAYRLGREKKVIPFKNADNKESFRAGYSAVNLSRYDDVGKKNNRGTVVKVMSSKDAVNYFDKLGKSNESHNRLCAKYAKICDSEKASASEKKQAELLANYHGACLVAQSRTGGLLTNEEKKEIFSVCKNWSKNSSGGKK